MNAEQARYNMIEQQIRPSQVFREDVRELLLQVRREEFVPTAWRNLAFADAELPLGHGAAMLRPRLEAQALQALGIRKHERVLEIGTGSGYMAALLAMHAERVVSIEIEPELAALARGNLHRIGVLNVAVEIGNGALGWPAAAPYDVIMVSGGLPYLPAELSAQLKTGGRLLAFVGTAPLMVARRVTRVADGDFRVEDLFETLLPSLRDVPAKSGFVL